MARRVSLPTADDLFRPTTEEGSEDAQGQGEPQESKRAARTRPDRPVAAVPAPEPVENARGRRSSGRVRHDEKMTVYVTADELVEIEHARLMLRRDHGLAVDRGRLVREALAIVLADLDEHGDDSELVRRLVR